MSRSRFSRRLGRIRPWWRRFKRNGYRRDRCDLCGHGFHWSRDARHSYTGSDKHWHLYCQAYLHQKMKAEQRLEVLRLVMDLSPLTEHDVKISAELRAVNDDERRTASGCAFAVFYDLARTAPERAVS